VILIETRDRPYQCGIGSRPRKLVEFPVVNVQHLVASACDFEPCRTQEEHPQAPEGLIATVRGERMKPTTRLVVQQWPTVANRRRRRRERRRR
jgi:hypothetical protein